jgi:hypothetical protein
MKNEPDAFGIGENEFGHAKRDPTPSVLMKMSQGAQNMNTGPDALYTAENESGRAKHEIGSRRPRYCQKRIRERKT